MPSHQIQNLSPFGQLLRYWRGKRGLSQLDLSLLGEVSARHLSFVETGRSQPSREMVTRLAYVLDVPLRERNRMLQAAGFAAMYRETDLASPALAAVRKSLGFLLERHNPYPAAVLDRHWNVLLMNRAATVTLARFIERPELLAPPINLMRLLFQPSGAKPFITNWDELAAHMIQRLHRDAAALGDDAPTQALLDEALSARGVPAAFATPDFATEPPVIVPMRLARDGVTLSLFSAITTLGTPQDITLQELRMETFFPADDASDAQLHALCGAAPRQ